MKATKTRRPAKRSKGQALRQRSGQGARREGKRPKRRITQAKDEIKPRVIAFEVTRCCQYECKHCRASAGPQGQTELTTQQCKKIISSLAKFSKPMLIFTGGEPMERPDIYELISYTKMRGMRAVMATCGYLLDAVSYTHLRAHET